jgi:integrase
LQAVEAAKGDRLEALYILAVTTGLRQGELLGLKWDDIDLEVGTLQVRTYPFRAEDQEYSPHRETLSDRLGSAQKPPGASVGGR